MVDSLEPVRTMLQKMHAGLLECGFEGRCFAVNTSQGLEGVHRNLLAFLYKLMYPESTYILAGLDYHIPGTTFENFGFAAQAELMCDIGIEGYKMYEGKPNARKVCGNIPLTDQKYRGFFEVMEQRKIPVEIHLGDPPHFWDSSKLTAYQGSKGWFFGDLTFASWQEIYDEFISLLSHYRKIPFIIPQLGYFFPDLDKLSSLLEEHENLFFDIAPSEENHFPFIMNNVGLCRSFFEKYSERLIFASTGVCENWSEAVNKAKKSLDALYALRLSDSALSRILSGTFESLCTWRPLNPKAIKKYASFVKEHIQAYSIVPEFSGIVERTLEVIDKLDAACKLK